MAASVQGGEAQDRVTSDQDKKEERSCKLHLEGKSGLQGMFNVRKEGQRVKETVWERS